MPAVVVEVSWTSCWVPSTARHLPVDLSDRQGPETRAKVLSLLVAPPLPEDEEMTPIAPGILDVETAVHILAATLSPPALA